MVQTAMLESIRVGVMVTKKSRFMLPSPTQATFCVNLPRIGNSSPKAAEETKASSTAAATLQLKQGSADMDESLPTLPDAQTDRPRATVEAPRLGRARILPCSVQFA